MYDRKIDKVLFIQLYEQFDRLAPGNGLFYYRPGATDCGEEKKKFCLCKNDANNKLIVECDPTRKDEFAGGENLEPGKYFYFCFQCLPFLGNFTFFMATLFGNF